MFLSHVYLLVQNHAVIVHVFFLSSFVIYAKIFGSNKHIITEKLGFKQNLTNLSHVMYTQFILYKNISSIIDLNYLTVTCNQ